MLAELVSRCEENEIELSTTKRLTDAIVASGYSPGFYDLDNPDNPFNGWTLVHIPYCTGDIHWGDNVVEYTDDLTIHHKGQVNFKVVMEWVKSASIDEICSVSEELVKPSSEAGSGGRSSVKS